MVWQVFLTKEAEHRLLAIKDRRIRKPQRSGAEIQAQLYAAADKTRRKIGAFINYLKPSTKHQEPRTGNHP